MSFSPSPDELADMQAAAAELMTGTALIETRQRTPDGAGGTTDTWATAATLPCSIAPARGMPAERLIAQRANVTELIVVTLPAGTVVAGNARITVDGRHYQVIASPPRNMAITQRVFCSEFSNV